MSEQSLDISWETILKVLITGFALYLLFLIRSIVIWFCFALIISILVEPAVNFLRRIRLPRVISVTIVYLAILGILGGVIYLTAPIFLVELHQLSQNIPLYFQTAAPVLRNFGIDIGQSFGDFSSGLMGELSASSSGVVKAITTFFGGVSSTFIIFTLAFFISLQEKGVEKALSLLSPKRYERTVITLFERSQIKVAGWFGARILACLFVGAASFIVFLLLGIKYAFILALMGAVLNFVPYIGPTIAWLVSIFFVGVSSSWTAAIYVLMLLLAIEEVEAKVISPVLMKKFMNLPPVLVLISLLVGERVFGFLGAIFAVPVFGIVYEFLKEFLEKKKEYPAGS